MGRACTITLSFFVPLSKYLLSAQLLISRFHSYGSCNRIWMEFLHFPCCVLPQFSSKTHSWELISPLVLCNSHTTVEFSYCDYKVLCENCVKLLEKTYKNNKYEWNFCNFSAAFCCNVHLKRTTENSYLLLFCATATQQ